MPVAHEWEVPFGAFHADPSASAMLWERAGKAIAMDLKLLAIFVAVAEYLHFGAAAEHLGMTQPQVSRSVIALEKRLDVQLFERATRAVKLTEVGAAFLPEAMRLLRAADVAGEQLARIVRGKHGVLKLSLIDAAALGAVPPILQTFHSRHPDIYLSFNNWGTTSAAQLLALGDGSADVVFTHPPSRRPDAFEEVCLVDDPLVAVVAAGHPLAGATHLRLHDLAAEQWVMFPRENDPTIYDRMIDLCRGCGFTPAIMYEAGAMLTRLCLVASGFGVHLIHARWATMPFPGVVYIPVAPTTNIRVSCFWRRDNANPLLHHLIDIVRTFAV